MRFFERTARSALSEKRHAEFTRFIVNGLVATGAHYAVLTFAMEVLAFASAALAGLAAAMVGTTVSFLGNRYFVFLGHSETWLGQALRFAGLYAGVASLHAAFLFLWTDMSNLDYRIGFVIVTAMQVMLTFLGNRYLVFAR